MTTKSAQISGGISSGIKSRDHALKKYYESPNICFSCGNVIKVPDEVPVSEIRRKKFCNHSCSARFNNTGRELKSISRSGHCEKCKEIISYKKRPDGGYSRRRFCDKCLFDLRSKNSFNSDGEWARIETRTKVDFFSSRKNWQSARSSIRDHAGKVYGIIRGITPCKVCGYTNHVEVCHIRAVSDFPDDALISEINNISNLIGLCPNHHWEFDHGFLNIAGNSTGVTENRLIT